MIHNQVALQLQSHHGMLADTLITREQQQARGFSKGMLFSDGNNSITHRVNDVVQDIPGEIAFPAFGYTLPVIIESNWSAGKQCLTLKIEWDEGVAFVWQTKGKLIGNGEVLLDGVAEIKVSSLRPRAQFIAATLHLLLMLDNQAVLRTVQPKFNVNMHLPDELKTASEVLKYRQLSYRLMVIEKAFNQEFTFPMTLSNADRSTVDFVYRAVVDRSFDWPFWQESFQLPANEQAGQHLSRLDGKQPFVLDIGYLHQTLLGQSLNLGEAGITIQNAAIVQPEKVKEELRQLDGHNFQATIKSLTGTANFRFLKAPHLPVNAWDKLLGELIELDGKLVDSLFNTVNELVAATLADLTEEEKKAVTERFTFDEEAFADPEFEEEN